MPKPDAFVKHSGETIDECRAMHFPTKLDGTPDVSNLFTLLKGNHNVVVSENNDANSGMHFVQPSRLKGVEGFEETADWVTVTALPSSGDEQAKVEITVKENATGAERTMLQTITVGDYTVKLTIIQGITDVNNPNEDETDQPAYSPDK
jgi:hypothetical protein